MDDSSQNYYSHFAKKKKRANWWSRISIVHDETMNNGPWECRITSLTQFENCKQKQQVKLFLFWNKNKLIIQQ